MKKYVKPMLNLILFIVAGFGGLKLLGVEFDIPWWQFWGGVMLLLYAYEMLDELVDEVEV